MKKHVLALLVTCAIGCAETPAFQRIVEARRLTAELLQQFTNAADATNRTVMADGTPASATFAKQADTALTAAQQNADALRSLLDGLRYGEELQLLGEFTEQFDAYRALDKRIHELMLESSNVTAQQMAFGPGDEAANAVERDVQAAVRPAPPPAMWQARALGGALIEAVRKIQVLQSRHIPENDDAKMDALERQMTDAEQTARASWRELSTIVPASSRTALAAASTALDRFMSLNGEITRLSRRNTNVHALALALGAQGALTVRCRDTLRALQSALSQRGSSGTR